MYRTSHVCWPCIIVFLLWIDFLIELQLLFCCCKLCGKFLQNSDMGRKKSKSPYAGIEAGLNEINRTIRGDKEEIHYTRILVAQIVKKIIWAMKTESPNVFGKLYYKIFGGGSSYEGLRIGDQGDFDVDVLLRLPAETLPRLCEDTIPGYVQLQLQRFEKLQNKHPELFQAMRKFVDDGNFLLSSKLKSTFMQSIFDRARRNYFPSGTIRIGTDNYQIARVQTMGPAFTLTIEGTSFFVQIDLVPCIVLSRNFWPQGGFRQNPYRKPSEFFIVPKKPKREHSHLDRYFRLSFQQQERKLISNRFWMKPTIRIMKLIRDSFDHKVSSYAIKTRFMWELERVDPRFWHGPPSFCLVYMLEKYLECLRKGTIWYFWNRTKKLNLLDNLSEEQIATYRNEVEEVVVAIKEDPSPEVIFEYLLFD